MSHRDAYLTEVVVVLENLDAQQTEQVVKNLEAAGMTVHHVNDEQSIVEGFVESHRVHDLEKVASVRYVRGHFTYAADFPPGDPRDRNNA